MASAESREPRAFYLPARAITPLCVRVDLRRIEVHLAQVARRVARRLIVEVPRLGIAALAAGRHGPCANAVPELDDGDEAVAARPVPALGTAVGPCAER